MVDLTLTLEDSKAEAIYESFAKNNGWISLEESGKSAEDWTKDFMVRLLQDSYVNEETRKNVENYMKGLAIGKPNIS